MNIQNWSPLGWTGWISLLSKGLSRAFSSTTVRRHQLFGAQPFLLSPFHIYNMTTGKTIALTIWTFVGKVMSLLFNILSRFVIAFLSRSKSFNFMVAVIICSDFGAQENKVCHSFHCFPIYFPRSNGIKCHDFVFWLMSFMSAFLLFYFTFIKRTFSSSISAIRVVSSVYLKLLIFLPAILIPACASFSPEILMMYSAYKLNKHGDNIQPWHTLFPIWNQSIVPCLVLTVAS